MMTKIFTRISLSMIALLLGSVTCTTVFGAATITIHNTDGPGEGFNDNTPAAPVGGNPGITVGEQRLNAFQFAANIWGATLNSNVPIVINARFDPLTPCSTDQGVLGSAGAHDIFADFLHAPFAGTWYNSALANAL